MLRRTSLICLEVVLAVIVLGGLLVAGSAWRLSQGPVSLQFLLPYAKDLLEPPGAPVSARLDDLILTWAGWERALDVRAVDVRLRRRDGTPLMRVGEVSVSLSFRALLQGTVAPTSLELIRPRLRLTRVRGGDIEIGMDDPGAAGEPAESRVAMVRSLLDALSGPAGRTGSLRYLNSVSVVGAAMRIEDTFLGLSWSARAADLRFVRDPRGLRASFRFVADIGAGGAPVLGDILFDKLNQRLEFKTRADGVDTVALAALHPRLAPLAAVKTSLVADVSGRLALDGDIEAGRFALTGGEGELAVPGGGEAVAFRALAVSGRLNRQPDQIQVADATLTLPRGLLGLKGVVTRVGDIAAVNASLRAENIPLDDLGRLWPKGAAEGARGWVVVNMRDGVVTAANASVTARMPMDAAAAAGIEIDSMSGGLSIAGATVDYLSPLPPISGASATATFSKSRFDFAVHGGKANGNVIEDGAVNIVNLGEPKKEYLTVTALIRGPVAGALGLVGHPRLDLLQRFGFDPAGARGRHATRLRIGFPLLRDVRADQVVVTSASNIVGLALGKVFRGKGIAESDLSLAVDNDGLRADGRGRYDGAPVQFVWEERFARTAPFTRRLSARLTLDARLRRDFGIDFPAVVDGPVPARLAYSEGGAGGEKLTASLDLTPAKLTVPGFDWAKPAGREGNAKIDAVLRDGRLTALPAFNVEAGVFQLAGNLAFAADGKAVSRLVLDRFALGSTRFAATVDRRDDGGFRGSASGEGFDVTPFVGREREGEAAPDLPAFDLEARFAKMWLGSGAPVRDATVVLERGPAAWRRIDVRANLPTVDKQVSVVMTPTAAGHELVAYSADAGAFLNAFGITDAVAEGSIEVSATRTGGAAAPWRGTALMKRFRAVNAPNLARLLTLASFTGISSLVSGKGIAFEQLDMPFRFEREVLTVTAARAVGSELGITVSGKVDFARDAIDLRGTIVPAYTINSLIGKIPVLGDLLVGEKGGGIFAANYSMSGPLEKPEIKINPLSALAPGFLRKLLEPGPAKPPPPGAAPETEGSD